VFVKHEEEVEEQVKYNRVSQINEIEYCENDEEVERKKKNEEMISCKNISKKEKGAENAYIVKDISFGVEKGKIMGLLGPSGAGKSTIFKLLTLMSARDSGVLRLAGVEINRYWEDYRLSKDLDLGFVFQEDVLWEDKTVDENLEIIGKLRGLRTNIM
jgi:ABC-type multidrug transport system ATPase subunit